MSSRTPSYQEEHLWTIIQHGVFRSYLPNLFEEEVSAFLNTHPQASTPGDLPPGRWTRMILREFDRHCYTEITMGAPQVERTNLTRRDHPPSVAELFIATAVAYFGTERECVRAAALPYSGNDCYPPLPAELARTLLDMNWTCTGLLEDSVLPTLSLIARASRLAGLQLLLPRQTWSGAPDPFLPFLHWGAHLPTRNHIPDSSYFDDFRCFPGNLASLSCWLLARWVRFSGPSCSCVLPLGTAILLALTHARAAARSPSIGTVFATNFFNGLAALPGLTAIMDEDRPPSETDTMSTNPSDSETDPSSSGRD